MCSLHQHNESRRGDVLHLSLRVTYVTGRTCHGSSEDWFRGPWRATPFNATTRYRYHLLSTMSPSTAEKNAKLEREIALFSDFRASLSEIARCSTILAPAVLEEDGPDVGDLRVLCLNVSPVTLGAKWYSRTSDWYFGDNLNPLLRNFYRHLHCFERELRTGAIKENQAMTTITLDARFTAALFADPSGVHAADGTGLDGFAHAALQYNVFDRLLRLANAKGGDDFMPSQVPHMMHARVMTLYRNNLGFGKLLEHVEEWPTYVKSYGEAWSDMEAKEANAHQTSVVKHDGRPISVTAALMRQQRVTERDSYLLKVEERFCRIALAIRALRLVSYSVLL